MSNALRLSLVVITVAACGAATEPTTVAPTTGFLTTAAPTTMTPTTIASISTTSSAPASTTPDTAPTITTTPDGEEVALVPTAGEMAASWKQAFVIPYGTTPETLGTAPGGDSGSLDIGPEYGAQTPDGTWWILDAAMQRIAHFSEAGEYIDQVLIPPDLLVDGVYFQFQLPKALDDGTVTAVGFREYGTALLTITDDSASETELADLLVPRSTDGTHLYLSNPDGELLRLDPTTGTVEPVEWLQARSGSRYHIAVDDSAIVIHLPDSAGLAEQRVPLRWAERPESPVHAGIQVDTGIDGRVFVFLYGAPEVDESVQVTGFLTISPEGAVSAVEATKNPFSASDPGSPSHLGVRPGTSDPWLMFVLEDGVHVYTRDQE